jgi:hypothetical protein
MRSDAALCSQRVRELVRHGTARAGRPHPARGAARACGRTSSPAKSVPRNVIARCQDSRQARAEQRPRLPLRRLSSVTELHPGHPHRQRLCCGPVCRQQAYRRRRRRRENLALWERLSERAGDAKPSMSSPSKKGGTEIQTRPPVRARGNPTGRSTEPWDEVEC